ncbi:MAG: DUF4249 family protein [Prolixibacteraceae bacterium]|jgi:hypothetical protein|nr:DUF4249 family protein [Prolixibacteraceae bacterium]
MNTNTFVGHSFRCFLCICLFACIFQACVTTVDIELPLQNSIVLNGLIVPGDTISVLLHRSGLSSDTTDFSVIENAELTLFINKEKTETLKYLGDGKYQSSFVAKELTNYKIEIFTVDNEKIWAETFTPEINFGAKINSAFELDSMQNNWPFYLLLKDNALYNNNYWVCAKQYEQTPDSIIRTHLSYVMYSNSKYIDKFNSAYDPEGNGQYYFDYKHFMFIEDVEFSGGVITVDFVPQLSGSLKQDNIIVYNMDEHYSNYLKSKMINEQGADYISDEGPPLNYKPTFLYSNVHGGMGILGSYTVYSKTYQYD